MILRDTNITRALRERQAPRSKQRGFLLNPYNFGEPQQPGDASWANVTSLLHCDGANDSTTVTDEKGIIWTASGGAKVTTARGKFGQSLAFNGTTSVVNSAANSGFAFGTGDYTAECFGYFSDTGGTNMVLMTWGDTAYTQLYRGSGVLYVYDGSGNLITGPSQPSNVWNHFRVTRVSGVMYLFRDGQLLGQATHTRNYTTTGFRLGCSYSNSSYLNGNVDEVRVTKGVGRSTTAFTVQSGPYPNYA